MEWVTVGMMMEGGEGLYDVVTPTLSQDSQVGGGSRISKKAVVVLEQQLTAATAAKQQMRKTKIMLDKDCTNL